MHTRSVISAVRRLAFLHAKGTAHMQLLSPVGDERIGVFDGVRQGILRLMKDVQLLTLNVDEVNEYVLCLDQVHKFWLDSHFDKLFEVSNTREITIAKNLIRKFIQSRREVSYNQ